MERTVPRSGATGDEAEPTDEQPLLGPESRPVLRRGQEIGRYLVLEPAGAGGMGIVYTAYDPELDRRLAIKLVSTAGEDDARARAHQLLREGRVLARLVHPNVVAIHDVGRFGDDVFIAMEHVRGHTLDSWIAQRSPGPWQVIEHCAAAGRGLAAAHREGIVHGDFKPTNVMVADDGRVVVLDFGLAHAGTSDDPADSLLVVTAGGAGTPAYMAPEQHEGLAPGPAADQFAFCVTLYEALCGHRPFEGEGRAELADRVLRGQPREPGDAMPPWLWRLVRRGLAVDPEQRHPSLETLLARLDPASRRRRRRRGWLAAAAVLVCGAVGASLIGPGPCDDPRAALGEAWSPQARQSLDERWSDRAAWPYVRARLDRTAARWQEHWSEACRATHVEQTQSRELLDRRLACLEGHRGQLAAFVERLSDPTTTEAALARLATRAGWLDAGASCADARSLLGRAPPPAEPRARATFDEIISEAQRWISRANAGRHDAPDQALAALEGLQARAETLGHPQALRWVWLARGTLLETLAREDEAARAYAHALRHAEAAGDDAAALTLASALVHVHASRLEDLAGARAWSELAESKLARVDVVSRSDRVGLRIHQATLDRRGGEPEAARARLERALELAEDDAAQRGTIHHNLGITASNLREHERAAQEFSRAIELRTEAFGPDHVVVGQSRYHLAQALIAQGVSAEAPELLDEAIRIFESADGADHERVMARAARGIVAATEGRLDEAIAISRRALDEAMTAFGPDDPEVSTLHHNIARMLMMQGHYDEAVASAERAVALEEARHGPDHPDLYIELSLLAELELHRGRPHAALAHIERGKTLAPSTVRVLQFEALAVYARLHVDCDLAAAQRSLDAVLDAHRDAADVRSGLASLIADLEEESSHWDGTAWPTTCAPLSEPGPAPPPAPAE